MFLFKKVNKIANTNPTDYKLKMNILFTKWSNTLKKLEEKCLTTIFKMTVPIQKSRKRILSQDPKINKTTKIYIRWAN